MTRPTLIILLTLTTFCATAQKQLIKYLAEGDTALIRMEKISCRSGLVSKTDIYATKAGKNYRIKFSEVEDWKTITSYQWRKIKKFGKSRIKKGWFSTNYVIVKISLRDKEIQLEKSWGEFNRLLSILEMDK